ncbi:major histocompatibility complex class I-related gene protein-like [Chanos chanos]|uniref:Major histocompatibility complex class I-related gene protein-like n=1 Tax=Chanos chanos TaxID=29144 RepID=A0A6J2WNP3_CHACN|nr:major histocompatibility complex class I-related gene protein-like [Chanos chanos]
MELNFSRQGETFVNVHSLTWHCVASQGLDLPEYFELVIVDDVPVFYYDSNMKGVVPFPEWLNSTTAKEYWHFLTNRAHFKKEKLLTGLKSATLQFNSTGIPSNINVYQAYGGHHLHPDGTLKSFLSHAFNGKDFISFDYDSKTFLATVPQAVSYKTMRQRDQADVEFLVSLYNKRRTAEGIKEFLQYNPRLRMKKVPEVRLFERKNSVFTEITCHVTGFYPRTVQVQWFGSDMQPVVEGVTEGEVLPNGDGSYQTRKSVVIPAEHTDIHHYSCVVQHSSIPGNITETWARWTIHTATITETSKIIYSTATVILEMLGYKIDTSHKEQYAPRRRRLEAKIKATWTEGNNKGIDTARLESEQYWRSIWEKEASHNTSAQWLVDLRIDHCTLPK